MSISTNGKLETALARPAEMAADARFVDLCLGSIDLWRLTGRIAEGRERLSQAAALVPAGDTEGQARIAEALGTFARCDGPYPVAVRHLEEARSCYRELGDLAGEARTLLALGSIAIDGAREQAADQCHEALRLARDAHDSTGIAQATHALAWIEIEACNIAEAESLLQASEQGAREADDALLAGRVQVSLGALRNRSGRFADAEQHFRRAETIWAIAGYREGIAEVATDLAALAIFGGRRADAIEQLRRSAEIYGSIGIRYRTAELIDTVAGLALLEGEREEARRWLTAAAAYRQSIPLRVWSTWSVHLTRWLSVEPQPGELMPVLALDEALGEVRAYLSALRSDAGDTRSRPHLSRREHQVLGLVAAGLSDQAIAEHLYISRRTASRHVSAVLRKLGLPSRTAAAVQAIRDGLVSD